MKMLPRMAAIASLLVACDPLVQIDEPTSEGSTSTGSGGGDAPGDPGSVPPNSTNPVTTSPSTTGPSTTGAGGECVPGTLDACLCPDGEPGEQECGADGTYLPCVCDGFESTTSGWGESSGGWGSSSSTGDPFGNHIPDLPPGETCLPLDLPCDGFFEIHTDDQLEALATCSRIAGDLFVQSNVTNLGPLVCLREITGGFVVLDTQVTFLQGLPLETAEFFALADNPQLVLADAPALQSVESLYIVNNDSLDTLFFPELLSIGDVLEVLGNDILPDCATVELFEQVNPPTLNCEENLQDKCSPLCG